MLHFCIEVRDSPHLNMHCLLFPFLFKRNTSRQTKPLKVQVMHSSIVAHQSFGLKLLTWLGSVIGYSGGENCPS